jgi:hypothetical protein
MIATQDIADVATKLLRDRVWSGQSVLGLHGATELNFDEAAQILGQVPQATGHSCPNNPRSVSSYAAATGRN